MNEELRKKKELIKFNEWRKEMAKTLPDLANRVFSLRDKFYMGCGFHWSLEKQLGSVIKAINDFDSSYRDEVSQIIVELAYEDLVERLEKIEGGVVYGQMGNK